MTPRCAGKRLHLICGVFLLVFSGTVTAQSRATGQICSGEWEVHWSPTGAFAIHELEPRTVLIYRNEFESCRTWTDRMPCPSGWFYRSSHRVLSAIGNGVSFTDGYEGSGGMHPIYGYSYESIDLDTGEEADITQLFDEGDIFETLSQEPLITKYLRGEPRNLEELFDLLGSPCEITFSHLGAAFRLKAIGDETAVVEFGLGHGCEVLRGNFTTLEVELPIPADLRELFLEARGNLPSFPQKDPTVTGDGPP